MQEIRIHTFGNAFFFQGWLDIHDLYQHICTSAQPTAVKCAYCLKQKASRRLLLLNFWDFISSYFIKEENGRNKPQHLNIKKQKQTKNNNIFSRNFSEAFFFLFFLLAAFLHLRVAPCCGSFSFFLCGLGKRTGNFVFKI